MKTNRTSCTRQLTLEQGELLGSVLTHVASSVACVDFLSCRQCLTIHLRLVQFVSLPVELPIGVRGMWVSLVICKTLFDRGRQQSLQVLPTCLQTNILECLEARFDLTKHTHITQSARA